MSKDKFVTIRLKTHLWKYTELWRQGLSHSVKVIISIFSSPRFVKFASFKKQRCEQPTYEIQVRAAFKIRSRGGEAEQRDTSMARTPNEGGLFWVGWFSSRVGLYELKRFLNWHIKIQLVHAWWSYLVPNFLFGAPSSHGSTSSRWASGTEATCCNLSRKTTCCNISRETTCCNKSRVITCCNNEKTINQDVNSVTGVTEKSDQMQTAGPHEENTKREKPDVKSWMKNYKKQRTDGKSNPGEQQTNEKAKQSEETLSRSRLHRETVHQRSEEKQSHTATAYGNKVENEQE